MKCYMNNEGSEIRNIGLISMQIRGPSVEISCIKIHTLLLPAWLYIICRYIVCLYTSRTVYTECLLKLRKCNLGKTHLSKTTRSPFLMGFFHQNAFRYYHLWVYWTSLYFKVIVSKVSFKQNSNFRGKYIDVKILFPFWNWISYGTKYEFVIAIYFHP